MYYMYNIKHLSCLYYCMPLFTILQKYNTFIFRKQSIVQTAFINFFLNTFFLKNFYHLNDLIWQDGMLIDFLQKKFLDKWVCKFLIYSAYLFNERVVFDKVIRFYIDLIVWPSQINTIFEFNSISWMLFVLSLIIITLFLLLSLSYFWTIFIL